MPYVVQYRFNMELHVPLIDSEGWRRSIAILRDTWIAPLAMLGALAVMFTAAQPAQAQNLVQDPNFSAGLTYYQSPYGDSFDATPTIYDGMTGVELSGSATGYVHQTPVVGYTSGVTYLFTLLAAAIDSNQPSTIYFGFGPTCACQNSTFDQNTALTQFSVSGTADSSSGSYLYIEASGGDAFVTGLDFEAAPAPIPGAGILSFAVLLAGLAMRGMSTRRGG